MMGNNNSGTPQFFNEALASNVPAPTPRRSGNKMPLIIFGVVAFIVFAIIIIALAITNNVPKESVITDFKILVNYAVNGKTDDVIDTTYDLSNGTEIVRRSQEYNRNGDYFKNIDEKSKAVIEAAKKSSLDQTLKDDIVNYSYALMAYSRLHEYSKYQESLIETYMADKNYDRTVRRVTEHYEDLTNCENEGIRKGAEELASGSKQYLYIVNELSTNNLDVRDFEKSMSEYYSDEQFLSYLSQLSRSYKNAQKSIGKVFTSYIDRSWDIITSLELNNEN